MKILKTLLYVVLALVLLFLIIAYFVPRDCVVERSIDINAPSKMVFHQVSTLENMSQWSPWSDMDPNMEVKFTGTPGSVGSQQYWNGNDQVGEGYNKITAVEEGKSVSTQLNFVRPWPGEAHTNISILANENGSTKATWNFSTHTSYPMNITNLFVNMDKYLGPDYEKGLSRLKQLSEQAMNGMEVNGFKLQLEDIAERYYIGVRQTIDMADLERFFAVQMAKVGAEFGRLDIKEETTPSAIYYSWDEKNQRTELLAGMYTANEVAVVKGMDNQQTPDTKAVVLNYQGNYENLAKAHQSIDQFLELTGYAYRGMVIEDYVSGPGDETDPTKWLTRIIYPIKMEE